MTRTFTIICTFLTLAFPLALRAETPLVEKTDDLELTGASVRYDQNLDQLIFEQTVRGEAGRTKPLVRGSLDGAPVVGYVFPTTLKATDVGFGPVEGIVALAATSHPDFDDTPLWDESGDGQYDNDGVIYHTHWVVLVEDERAPGGLSVKQYKKGDDVILPPTNPGMPMYLDSPGFPVIERKQALRIPVPLGRVNGNRNFRFDAVIAYMEVSTDPEEPMLAVHEVYGVLSGDLSLPYEVSVGGQPAAD